MIKRRLAERIALESMLCVQRALVIGEGCSNCRDSIRSSKKDWDKLDDGLKIFKDFCQKAFKNSTDKALDVSTGGI